MIASALNGCGSAAPAQQRGATRTCGALARPLSAILEEVRALVLAMTTEQYTRPMGELFANATVGGHVRHCLDHARAVIDGRHAEAVGVVDYDHRQRGTAIETRPAAAASELAALIRAVDALADVEADEPIRVAVMPTRSGTAVTLESSLGRELAFVLSHTVHHNATVRGMAIALGVPVPATLGYAPATLAHQDQARCAR